MDAKLKIYLSKFDSRWGSFANGNGLSAAISDCVDAVGENDETKPSLFVSKLAKRNKDTFMNLIFKSLSATGKDDDSKEVYLFGMYVKISFICFLPQRTFWIDGCNPSPLLHFCSI